MQMKSMKVNEHWRLKIFDSWQAISSITPKTDNTILQKKNPRTQKSLKVLIDKLSDFQNANSFQLDMGWWLY